MSEIFYLRSWAFNGQLKCKMEANAKAKMEGGLLPFGFWFSKQKTKTKNLLLNDKYLSSLNKLAKLNQLELVD